MGIQQKNLTIVFRAIQPEMLYAGICGMGRAVRTRAGLSASQIGEDIFQSLGHTQYPGCSYEELGNIHSLLREQMRNLPNGSGTAPSVFYIPVWMAERVLRQNGEKLVYDFTQALAWRNVYQELGQDMFTTAYLAYEDLRHGNPPRTSFTWEAILKSDNSRLNTLLREGIAENHCHLGGTTQNFPLSWACLMNYPDIIADTSERLKWNLQPIMSRGLSGNVWSWEQRLQWAAYLRLELFKILEGGPVSSLDMLAKHFYPFGYIRKEISTLRFAYGAAVPVKGSRHFVLDYALRSYDCSDGTLDSHNRLLSGERSFLYRCFTACFNGTFDEALQSWFYLYLLIKENFRAEIVQVNRQPGFYNFKIYQDRKDIVYERFPGYRAEALRLSVNASQSYQHIRSFEARIAPKSTPKAMQRQIRENKRYVNAAGGLHNDFHLFYVCHFIKIPEKISIGPLEPRNAKLRKDVREKADVLARFLRSSQQECEDILGIDAANIEIGCRPEVFAVAFRFLRDLSSFRTPNGFFNRSTRPHLHATYHVGEDFLDIADGLRAIDETIHFLRFRRGDRLGHALALGVDPQTHYLFKGRRIVLPRQDLLDNLVWLLFRSQEIGVDVKPQLRARLQTYAEALLHNIYGEFIQDGQMYAGLYQYYCSMQLRGDAPELYAKLPYKKTDGFRQTYESYQENPQKRLDTYRQNLTTAMFCQAYHYDNESKRRGAQIEEFLVDEMYIELIGAMQDKMSQVVADIGLMIECNPTSNYLIGTFRRYERHPIFRFNNAELTAVNGTTFDNPQISVSINTDDLGIFDTSLENEYAILAASLDRAVDESGARRFTRDSIYKYLDNVRKMGIAQSFFFAEEKSNERNIP